MNPSPPTDDFSRFNRAAQQIESPTPSEAERHQHDGGQGEQHSLTCISEMRRFHLFPCLVATNLSQAGPFPGCPFLPSLIHEECQFLQPSFENIVI